MRGVGKKTARPALRSAQARACIEARAADRAAEGPTAVQSIKVKRRLLGVRDIHYERRTS